MEKENKKMKLKIKRENRKNSAKKVKKIGLLNLLMVLFLMMFLFSFVFKSKENIFSIRRQNKIALKAPIVFSTYKKEDFKYEEKEGQIYISSLTEKGKEKLKAGSFNLKVPGKIDEKIVKGIKAHAFQKEKINALALSDGIEIVEEYAFANNNLTSISLPTSLKEIGNYAFRDNKLEKLDLSLNTKLLKINLGAFSNNNLSELKLNSTLNLIGNSAFEQNNLVKVQIPESVKTFGQTVFTKNGRYVKVETKNPLIKSEKIKGSFGHIVNPVYIEVKYTGIEDVTKPNEKSELMPSKILGDDLSKENEVFILNEPNTFIPEKIYGYNTKSKLDFTPDKDGFVLEVIYYNIKKEPVIKENNIPNLKLNEKVDKERLLSFVTVEDVAGFKAENINLTVTPETLDTATGGLKKVTYKAENEFGFASTKEVEIPVALNWYEYPIGGGWTLGDFKYAVSPEGENVLLGYSEQGQEKAETNHDLILPGVMPDDTSARYSDLKKITQIGVYAKEVDDKYFNTQMFDENSREDDIFVKIHDEYKKYNIDPELPLMSCNKVDFRNLTELKYIGAYSFDILGESRNSGDFVFVYCEVNLSQLNNLELIGYKAFGFYNIDSTEIINDVNFENCNKLRYIAPNNFASRDRYSTPSFDEGYNVKNISKLNFKGCYQLEHIGAGFFNGLGLEEINLNDLSALKHIGDGAFSGNFAKKISINDCKNLEFIGRGAFSNQLLRENLDLSNLKKLKKIDTLAFSHLQNLTYAILCYFDFSLLNEIDLSGCESLEYIGNSAFVNLYSKNVILKNCKNLRGIGENAFAMSAIEYVDFNGCDRLEEIGKKYGDYYNGNISGAFSILGLPSQIISMKRDGYARAVNYNYRHNDIDFSVLPNLKYIDAFDGIIKSEIDFSKNKNLEYIAGFDGIKIGELEYLEGNIYKINIKGLTKLKEINGFNGQKLTQLDFSTNLNLINIGYSEKNKYGAFNLNKIEALDLTKNAKLKFLYGFHGNEIQALDLTHNINLEKISGFDQNKIINIDFSKNRNLKYINGFSSNFIKKLEIKNLDNLEFLKGFGSNEIEDLNFENLSKLKEIGQYSFYRNKITELDLRGASNLEELGEGAFNENLINSEVRIPDTLNNIYNERAFIDNSRYYIILRTNSGNNPKNLKKGYRYIVDPIELRIQHVNENDEKLIADKSVLTDGGYQSINASRIPGYIPKQGYKIEFKERILKPEDREKGYIEFKIVYEKENVQLNPNIDLGLSYRKDTFPIGDNVRVDIKLDVRNENLSGSKLIFYVEDDYLDSGKIKIPESSIIKSYAYKSGILEIELNEVKAGTSIIQPILFELKSGITPDNVYFISEAYIMKDNKMIAKAGERKIKAVYNSPYLETKNRSVYSAYEKVLQKERAVNDRKIDLLDAYISYGRSLDNVEYELILDDVIYIDDSGNEKLMKPKVVGNNWNDLGNGKYKIKVNSNGVPAFFIDINNLKLDQNIGYSLKAKLNVLNRKAGEKDIVLSSKNELSINKSYETYSKRYENENWIHKDASWMTYNYYKDNKDKLSYGSKLSLDKDDQNIKNLKIVEDNLDKRLSFTNVAFEYIQKENGEKITPNAIIKEYKFKNGKNSISNEDILLSEEKVVLQENFVYEFKNPNEVDYYTIEIEGDYKKLYASYNTAVKIKDGVVLFKDLKPLEKQIETFDQRLNVYYDGYSGSVSRKMEIERYPVKVKANINGKDSAYKSNVLAGEKGTYNLFIDLIDNYTDEELKNFKAVLELPDGIDIEEIEVSNEFKKSISGKYEIIDRYNGKQNAAIVFTADNFKFRGGLLATIKTKTSNMMDERTYTASFKVNFDNDSIIKEQLGESESFKLAAAQEIVIDKMQRVLKDGTLYKRRNIDFDPNDTIGYKISVINKTTEDKDTLSIIDVLPFEQDVIYTFNTKDINENETLLDIKEGTNRGTNINIKYLGQLLINGKYPNETKYGVKYSTSDPKLKKLIWQENLPEDLSKVTAIKVFIKNGYFEVGERLDVTFNVKADLQENLSLEERYKVAGKVVSNDALKKDTLTNGKYVSTGKRKAKISAPKGTISFIKKGYKKSFWESIFTKNEILNAKGLKGVVFNIIDEKGNFVKSAESNSKGEVVFEDIEVGNYTIREVSAPAGYSVSDEEIAIRKEDFKIEDGKIKLELKEVLNAYPLCQNLKIIKKDVKGNPLKGIEFEIEGKQKHNKDIKLNAKTDKNGEIIFSKLKEGSYTVQEIIKNTVGETNYSSIQKEVSINVDKNNIETNGTYGTTEVEVVNDTARVVFNVIGFDDEVSNKPESKYKHISEISNFNKPKLKTNNLVFEEILEENGEKKYKEIKTGPYGVNRSDSYKDYGYIELKTDKKYRVSLKEEDFDDNYQGKYKSYEFYLTPSGKLEELNGKKFKENRINFPVKEKELKGEVTVFTKLLLNTEFDRYGSFKRKFESVKGTKYDLFKIQGLKEMKIDTKEADENGILKFENLSKGTYIVRNAENPLNYMIKDKEFKFTVANPTENDRIRSQSDKDHYINYLITEDEIEKKDLEDAKNGVYYKGLNSIVENNIAFGVLFEAKKLDLNLVKGEMVLSNIPKEDAENKLKELEGTRAIEKGGFVDIVKPLNDVKFDLYENDKLIGERRSDEKGNINLDKGLSDKNTYTIVEKQAADGYMLDKNPVSIDINSLKKIEGFTGKIDRFIENKPYEGSLTVSKYDRKTKKVLEGIEFTLYKEEDGNLKEFKKGVTNNIGLIEFKTLPIGKYEVKETNTIDGYIKEDFTQKFEVTKDNTKFNYVFYNEQVSHDLYINVVDKAIYDVEKPNSLQDPNAYIKDAEFVLSSEGKYLKVIEQDEKTNVIKKYEWVDKKDRSILKTNEKGEIIIEKLYRGNYILEEVKAAEFYKLPLINSRDITIKDKNVDVLIINERKVKMPVSGVDKLMRSSLLGLLLTFTGRLLIRRKKKEDLKKRTIRK